MVAIPHFGNIWMTLAWLVVLLLSLPTTYCFIGTGKNCNRGYAIAFPPRGANKNGHSRAATIVTPLRLFPRKGLNRGNNDTQHAVRYRDDCFGWIVLTSLILARDVAFCGMFVTLSLTAQWLTRVMGRSWTPAQKRGVPAGVAGATLLLHARVRTLVSLPHVTDHGRLAEGAVCFLSILYGLFQNDGKRK